MFKTTLFAAAALLSAGSAQAEDLLPMAGRTIALDDASGSVYYTREDEGFRVVATLSGSEGAAPVRFVATLVDGQSVTIGAPAEAGRQTQEIEISRDGETLSVVAAEPLMVRASLD